VRCDLNGSNFETIVTLTDKPAYLAIDVDGGKIYWTDYVVDVVRRANLDGTLIEELYAAGANLNPDGIALDLTAGKIYWGQTTDLFADISKLMRMNLDGSQPQDVTGSDFGLISDVTLGPTRAYSRGDMNCDGHVDFGDINPFVLALSSRNQYQQAYPNCNYLLADINGDGVLDFDDINPFVACITHGGCP
jgi:hypothetical protein